MAILSRFPWPKLMMRVTVGGAKLVTGAMKSKVEQTRKDIIAGNIKVHDYMSNNKCPVQ